MSEPPRTSIIPFLLALLVAAASVAIGLGAIPFVSPGEARNAAVAQEMLTTGSFLVPAHQGVADLSQPALYFDLVAGAQSVLGYNETAARAASAAFGMLTLLVAGLVARRTYGNRGAALVVLTIAATPLFIVFSRTVMTDMALTFFVMTALFAGFTSLEKGEQGSRGWSGLTMLAAALGTLTAGPVGVALPLLGLFVYAVLTRTKGFGRFFALDNLLIFLIPVGVWYVLLSLNAPGFSHTGLFNDALARLSALTDLNAGAPHWYLLAVLAIVMLPWSLLLPGVVLRGWIWIRKAARLDFLLLIFALAAIGFFTLAQSRHPGAILPAVVALAMLTARVFGAALARPEGRAATLVRRGTVLMALLAIAAGGLLAADRLGYLSVPEVLKVEARHVEEVRALGMPLIVWFLAIGLTALIARGSRRITVMFVAFLLPVVLLAAGLSAHLRTSGNGISSIPVLRLLGSAEPRATVVSGQWSAVSG